MFIYCVFFFYYSWAPSTITNLHVLNLVNFNNEVHSDIDSEWWMRPFVLGCGSPSLSTLEMNQRADEKETAAHGCRF